MRVRRVLVVSAAVLGVIIGAAVWTGVQAGRWQAIHHDGESITIPPNWHPLTGGKTYGESTRSPWGLRFLREFTARDIPPAAQALSAVGPHVHEWKIYHGHHVTYYGVWSEAHHTRSIKICVPRSQQNLALAILGSWQPLSH